MKSERVIIVKMIERACYMMAYVAAKENTFSEAKEAVKRWHNNGRGAIVLWCSATGDWDNFNNDIDILDNGYQQAIEIAARKGD